MSTSSNTRRSKTRSNSLTSPDQENKHDHDNPQVVALQERILLMEGERTKTDENIAHLLQEVENLRTQVNSAKPIETPLPHSDTPSSAYASLNVPELEAKDTKSWYSQMEQLSQPKFSAPDTATKVNADRLYKIRLNHAAKITKLRNLKNTEDFAASNINWFETRTTYCWWKRDVETYFRLLSPHLYEWTKHVTPQLDFDKIIDDPNFEHPAIPDELNLSTLDLLEATQVLTASFSDDYSHLIDDIGPTEVSQAFFRAVIYFEPNSVDTRSLALRSFYTQEIHDNFSIDRFASELRKKQRAVNTLHGQTLITENCLVSTLRTAIQRSSRQPVYAQALSSVKAHSLNLQQFLGHLNRCADFTLMPASSASANMARTRGGSTNRGGATGRGNTRGRGGRGRGGRGRGRGGSAYGPRTTSEAKQDVYLTAKDKSGNLLVGKTISQKKIKDPCFHLFTKGKCTRKECPYNHNFNVIPTTVQDNATPEVDLDEPDHKHDTDADGEEASLAYETADDEDGDDGFFASYSSLNPTDLQANHAGCSTHDADDHKWSNIFLIMCLPLTILWLALSVSIQLLSKTVVYSTRILFKAIKVTVTSFISTLVRFMFITTYNLECFMTICKNNVGKPHPYKHPIILDSGATANLTGDLSLFIKATMRPYKVPVTLADSRKKIYSSHVGKINVAGQIMDAVYVPQMKTTLLSLGHLAKQGILSHSDIEGNIHLTLSNPQHTPFLSFSLSNNNLYYLLEPEIAKSA